MRRLVAVTGAAIAVVALAAPAAAPAYEGPCATQRALFEKYNIQLDMTFPLAEEAYGEVCSHTG